MSRKLGPDKDQTSRWTAKKRDDAVTSALGNLVAHFLRENKDKGRPLTIPSLGIILYPDGSEEKIRDSRIDK